MRSTPHPLTEQFLHQDPLAWDIGAWTLQVFVNNQLLKFRLLREGKNYVLALTSPQLTVLGRQLTVEEIIPLYNTFVGNAKTKPIAQVTREIKNTPYVVH